VRVMAPTIEAVQLAWRKHNELKARADVLRAQLSELDRLTEGARIVAASLEYELTDNLRGLKPGTSREAAEYTPAFGNTD
jgi:hypothetical protein